MKLKEKIKREIDLLPEEYLPQIEQYIEIIKKNERDGKTIKTIHLNGRFDNINIRKLVYEEFDNS